MRKKIVPILACPKCGASLELKKEKKFSEERIQKGKLKCNKCGADFKIVNEVIYFEPVSDKESDKKIEKIQKLFLDQELKRKWLKHFTEEEFTAVKKEWRWMIDKLGLSKSRIHLDWATGTGRFLRNILDISRGEIIALENDYATCVGLRDFLKKIGKYSRVTIICGDARNMPLANSSIDSISSWHGLDEPRISGALSESHRILKENKTLTASGLYYEEDSESLRVALQEGIKFAERDKAYQYLKELEFGSIDYKRFLKKKWLGKDSFLPQKGDYYTSYAVAGRKV